MKIIDLREEVVLNLTYPSRESVVDIGNYKYPSVRITAKPDQHPDNPKIRTENHHIGVHKISLGNFISIAMGCQFYLSGNHDWQRTTTYLNPFKSSDNDGLLSNGDISIGSDVWIGDNCKVMSGVNIGTGSVIAAGSIVTRDIPPYSIAGGIPCKVIKKRFSDDIIERLITSKWWELPELELKKYEELLFSRNIQDFLYEIERI